VSRHRISDWMLAERPKVGISRTMIPAFARHTAMANRSMVFEPSRNTPLTAARIEMLWNIILEQARIIVEIALKSISQITMDHKNSIAIRDI